MMTREALYRSVAGLDPLELESWIGKGWLRPGEETDPSGGGPFQDIDAARLRLILDLRRLGVDDDAMLLVLDLLDQIYSLRRRMRVLHEALAAQPPELQRSILSGIVERHGTLP